MGSDVLTPICWAHCGKAVEDFPGTVMDGRLASHLDVYPGPNAVALGRRNFDGARSVHLDQSHPATQRMDAVDRIQEQPRASLVDCHQKNIP